MKKALSRLLLLSLLSVPAFQTAGAVAVGAGEQGNPPCVTPPTPPAQARAGHPAP